MVEEGEDLRIFDNKTKEDITNSTFAQIIFEREKAQQNVLSLSTLRSMIQAGSIEKKEPSPIQELQLDVAALKEMIVEDLKDAFSKSSKFPKLEQKISSLEVRVQHIEKTLLRIENVLAPKDSTLIGTTHNPYRNLPHDR